MSQDLRIEIDPAILEKFPHGRVGAFLATGLRSIEPPDLSVEAARAFLRKALSYRWTTERRPRCPNRD